MARDQAYEAAIEKGTRLLQMMLASDHKAGLLLNRESAQSIFTSVNDLATYGYEGGQTQWGFSSRRLSKALEALGVDAGMGFDGGKNSTIRHEHSKPVIIQGKAYAATKASLAQVCNHEDGVLIAYDNRTAPHTAALHDDDSIIEYPPLVHWSDIAYLQWLLCNPAPANLKYVFRVTIQNKETNTILNKILIKHCYTQYEVWPGVTFDAESEEGRAILGTPNGSGTAWLLIQHKKQLESKRVERITVFYAENDGDLYRWPSLLFWVV